MHDATNIRTQLEGEREIIQSATEGPWYAEKAILENFYTAVYYAFHNGDTMDRDLIADVASSPARDGYEPDAEFIVHARTALPVRNAQIEAVLVRAESWELQATCEGTINPIWAEAIKHCAADIRRAIEEAA